MLKTYEIPDIYEVDSTVDHLKMNVRKEFGSGSYFKINVSDDITFYKYGVEYNQDLCLVDKNKKDMGFSIIVVQEGEFKHINSHTSTILNPQNTYLYFRNDERTLNLYKKNEKILVYMVSFSENFMVNYFCDEKHKSFINKIKSYQKACSSEFVKLNFNVRNLFTGMTVLDNWTKELLILSNAYKLLFVCIDYMEHNVKISSNEMKYLHEVINYIENNLEQNLKVETIAKACKISENKMQKIFKVYFEKNVYEYIVEQKMKLASKLIKRGELNLKQISSKLGYSYQSNFSYAFKKYFGVSPKSFFKNR